MSTQTQLEAHERECAMFRQLVDAQLKNLHWRITWLSVIGGAMMSAIFGTVITILLKLG
jgi:hypothetical protein